MTPKLLKNISHQFSAVHDLFKFVKSLTLLNIHTKIFYEDNLIDQARMVINCRKNSLHFENSPPVPLILKSASAQVLCLFFLYEILSLIDYCITYMHIYSIQILWFCFHFHFTMYVIPITKISKSVDRKINSVNSLTNQIIVIYFFFVFASKMIFKSEDINICFLRSP